MSALALKGATLPEILLKLENCTRWGARFITPSEEATFYPYQDVLRRAQKAAAALQAQGLQRGDRVALILSTSIEFFDSLLGVQLAGGIPAALYPPFRLGKLDEYFARLRKMLTKIGARFLITEGRIRKLLGPGVVGVQSLQEVLEAKDLQNNGHRWQPVDVDPDQAAFLQFSSGTTVEPKAVMVTHTNLLANLTMMQQCLVYRGEDEIDNGCVCWLPLYHDMGLVGCLYLGMYYPGTVTYMGPDTFLAKPAIWLRTLSRYKSPISPAPHFAYSLCATKIKDEEMEGVDLSRWRAALNGAEPIETDGVQRFTERFARWGFKPAALTPVYGLAEAGLGVTFTELDDLPKFTEFSREGLWNGGTAHPGEGRRIVSVGRALPGVEVAIFDDLEQQVPENRVGRIWVKGPSITKGYWESPELTANMIHGDWLDTGDLGFFHDGELYIAGRAKDLIIIRGRNYAPQEMEELLLDVDGVRKGCTVAVSTMFEGEGEQLIILAEKDPRSKRPDEDVIAEINHLILKGLSLKPRDVELLEPGTLPRTSSGKLRRSEALRQFLAGELVPPERVNALKLLFEVGKSQLAWAKFRAEKK
ncbi:MAG TPA: fatty acyl-AMP ligase [Bryobacteraceae bacterium]|nr:fatty acyl-AMP ligase [Bryobacteraceae bacterium]